MTEAQDDGKGRFPRDEQELLAGRESARWPPLNYRFTAGRI